jgi:hypothetical protein
MIGRTSVQQSDPHAAKSVARRGGTAIRIAIAVSVVVALLIGGIALLVGRTDGTVAPLRSPDPAGTQSRTPAHDAPLSVPQADSAARTSEGASTPSRAADAERFAGRGRIRGEIHPGPGVTLPAEWTLVIEPHDSLLGSEHAVTKRIDLAKGERAFDSGEVPLAGYRVRAEAKGLNSTEAGVILDRVSHDVFVTLELKRAGLIDGRVFAADGSPADGLELVLQPKSSPVRRRTTVGPDATFVFRDVVDGEYSLFVGPPEAPLFPPADIAFQAPTLRRPDLTLPPTGTIAITTLDDRGLAVGDVEVTGSGAPRGTLRVTTGASGRAQVRWLLPGKYHLEARSADGRRAMATIEVRANETAQAALRLGSR